jgi:hypothetical protein
MTTAIRIAPIALATWFAIALGIVWLAPRHLVLTP